MPYAIEYFHKLLIDFEDSLSGMCDDFAGNIVEFVADGLNGMFLPVLLKGFPEKNKKIVG